MLLNFEAGRRNSNRSDRMREVLGSNLVRIKARYRICH